MKVEDRHIEEALRGNCLSVNPRSMAWARGSQQMMFCALTLAKLECAVEALEPFATWAENEVDAEGWKNPPMRERIVDWFGPSYFRAAAEALTQIRSESNE